MQGQYGWDILKAANAVKKAAQAEDDEAGAKAAAAIHKRASKVSACLPVAGTPERDALQRSVHSVTTLHRLMLSAYVWSNAHVTSLQHAQGFAAYGCNKQSSQCPLLVQAMSAALSCIRVTSLHLSSCTSCVWKHKQACNQAFVIPTAQEYLNEVLASALFCNSRVLNPVPGFIHTIDLYTAH